MRGFLTVASGVLVLIGIFLILARGRESVNIINALAGNAVEGIIALQGR